MKKIVRNCTLGLGLLASALSALAQARPAELKIGMTTFLSAPAAVFGVPGKAAAEIMIDNIWRPTRAASTRG